MTARRDLVVLVAGVAVVAACVDIIGITDVPDGATTSEAGEASTADSGTRCDPGVAFGTPFPVPGLQTNNVLTLSMSPDELTVYIARSAPVQGAQVVLSMAQRTSRLSTFGAEKPITTNLRVVDLAISYDQLKMVYSQLDLYDGGGNPPAHLLITTHANKAQPFDFSTGTPLTGLNLALESTPSFRDDGSQLYYTEVSSGISLRVSNADAGFAQSAPVDGLPNGSTGFVVSGDGLVAYFTIITTFSAINYATRDAVDSPFGTANATNLPSASANSVVARLITDDLCTIYFEQRYEILDGGSPAFATQLYVANRSP